MPNVRIRGRERRELHRIRILYPLACRQLPLPRSLSCDVSVHFHLQICLLLRQIPGRRSLNETCIGSSRFSARWQWELVYLIFGFIQAVPFDQSIVEDNAFRFEETVEVGIGMSGTSRAYREFRIIDEE